MTVEGNRTRNSRPRDTKMMRMLNSDISHGPSNHTEREGEMKKVPSDGNHGKGLRLQQIAEQMWQTRPKYENMMNICFGPFFGLRPMA